MSVVITEADTAAIQAAYQQGGEFAAAIEVRRRFLGITDNAVARQWSRTIAGWSTVELPGASRPKSLPPRRQDETS
jgi:hypothetical protein